MPSFTLVISDEPFSRDDLGPAPFLETIEHGANSKCSTPATEAFKRCLDAVRDDGLSAATLAKDLRGALVDLYSNVLTASEAHDAGERGVWATIKAALKRADPVVDGFDDPMGILPVCEAPFPWHVAEWDANAGVCVRAADGNSVFWAESGELAAAIVARMNAAGNLEIPDGPTAPPADDVPALLPAPVGSAVADLECLGDALVDGLEVLRDVRAGKRLDGFDLSCLGPLPHNEFESRRRIMNMAEHATQQAATALKAVHSLTAWPRIGTEEANA